MSRSQIFSKIRETTDNLATKASYPTYETSVMHSEVKLKASDLWDAFSENFKAVNGRPMTSVQQLAEFLDGNNQKVGYCDPDLFESIGKALVAAGL